MPLIAWNKIIMSRTTLTVYGQIFNYVVYKYFSTRIGGVIERNGSLVSCTKYSKLVHTWLRMKEIMIIFTRSAAIIMLHPDISNSVHIIIFIAALYISILRSCMQWKQQK